MATEVDAPLDERILPPLPPRECHVTVAELDELVGEQKRKVELLDGVVLVSPFPRVRHNDVVLELAVRLRDWCDTSGGRTLIDTGVRLADDTLLGPDVLVLDADQLAVQTDPQYVRMPPRLVVEISSPSTRSRDLGFKRDAYGRFGVAEYWFVDLDRDEVMVSVADERGFTEPRTLGAGDVLRATSLPGFEVAVDEVLAPR